MTVSKRKIKKGQIWKN